MRTNLMLIFKVALLFRRAITN